MWKVIREILALIWKLLRTLVKDRLRAILKRIFLMTLFVTGFIALLVFVLTRLF